MLSPLIQRLEEAEGPDRGLDGFIARDVEGWSPHFDLLEGDELLEWPVMGGHWHPPGEKCDPAKAHDCEDPPPYTASLDAAIGLLERVLPGWWVEHLGDDLTASEERTSIFGATVELSSWETTCIQGQAATRPLALCLALLKALKEKQE